MEEKSKSKYKFMKKFFAKFLTLAFFVSVFSFSPSAKADESYCPVAGFWQSKSELSVYVYSSSALNNVTNHTTSASAITGWNCKDNRFKSLLIEDNFGVTSQASLWFALYFPRNVANCWRVKHIYESGEGEWSNKVCYGAPSTQPVSVPVTQPVSISVTQPVSISGIYMYLNSGGVMDGNVYIKWTKSNDSGSLYWTTCPPAANWNPSNPSWSYEQVSYQSSGQTIFSSHASEGLRCFVVAAKSSQGVLSTPIRVEYTYSSWMAQPYSSSPNYVAPNPTQNYTNFSGGGTSSGSSSSNSCVGICYGVPSKVNGLPRDNYVSGYTRKDGTYVKPYTRSKP